MIKQKIKSQKKINKSSDNESNKIINFSDPVLESINLNVLYGKVLAVKEVNIQVPKNKVVSLIGPSGCGKSTLIRCFNRMNDTIRIARVNGQVLYNKRDVSDMDPAEVRYRIGMVFQKPNPFPKSIYENVAFGPKVNGIKENLDEIVETSLRKADLWKEVKDRLKENAYGLSGGQQQRLCIARTLAVNPEVILMDEPCSALDPISTDRIEELIKDLSSSVTIVIVTHNMQQAVRVSDYAACMMAGEERIGELIEYGEVDQIFGNPKDKRTEEYVTGRIG
ncbi:MAG: phosphate ABC transporter ATP-binding protein [Dehalococcoidia bacterium]|nr:phosphate ABC transporter ATP-binding protein [Dehalococcoidia bacterium]MEC7920842.1 phosphate ABC transporter ATP-binding protein PstB [Chloroflexota bacterium]MQG04348.1 phosphate ABC transporter ATP-binding protein [SAR202 cluster bacterium]|tara:strand:+ start:42 stop:878 length:837 start_codon:yes stop_codon:yes gene_type:complete